MLRLLEVSASSLERTESPLRQQHTRREARKSAPVMHTRIFENTKSFIDGRFQTIYAEKRLFSSTFGGGNFKNLLRAGKVRVEERTPDHSPRVKRAPETRNLTAQQVLRSSPV
jgi:hypothetical protein